MNYLDRNEFNFEPSERVKEAFRNFDISNFCFYTRIYDRGKKSILSEYLSGLYGIDEKQVLLGYGAEDLLKMAIHFFLTDGDNKTMLIPKFSWWYYKSIASEVGGETIQYPVYETEDTFRYDMDELLAMIADVNPRILLIASPNNPTGNGLTAQEMARIMENVPEKTIVVVDEAYASFTGSDTGYIKELVEKHPNMIVCRTFSKFYGLPGLRLGFGFTGQSGLMERFSRYANKYLGYDRLSEEMGIAALESEDHYRKIAGVMDEARRMYTEEIGALRGFKVYRSVANFILIRYPIELKPALQAEFAGEDYKVKFMDEPDLNTHMRITLGRREQNRTVADVILRIAKQAGL